MIGKTIYKAEIRDNKIVITSNTIVKETYRSYYFDEAMTCNGREFKRDVGVTVFLTPKAAMDYLISELERLKECGETYLAKTKEHLKNAKEFVIPEN